MALEISADFLKVFDFEDTAKNYYNYSTNTFAETSHDNEVNQAQEIINNFPIDQFAKATSEFLEMQKEHYEKEQQIIIDSSRKDTEIALLKQELEFLKNKK